MLLQAQAVPTVGKQTHSLTIQRSADSAAMQPSAQEAPQQSLVRSGGPGI